MVMENNINKNLFRMVCNQFNSIIALTSIANRNIKLACTPISMQKLPNKIIFFSLHLLHGSFFILSNLQQQQQQQQSGWK